MLVILVSKVGYQIYQCVVNYQQISSYQIAKKSISRMRTENSICGRQSQPHCAFLETELYRERTKFPSSKTDQPNKNLIQHYQA